MACAQLDGIGRTCQVYTFNVGVLGLTLSLQLIDAIQCQLLQLVNLHADRLLLVSGYLAEIIHQGSNLTLLAQIFQSELFNFLSVLCA